MFIFEKPISRYLALVLTFVFALMDVSMAQNNNWQRQQQQQQMANQQRQQQQIFQQQQRAQYQEAARQQARERQQRETRAVIQGDIRARESQRVRNETTQRLRNEEANKVRTQVRNDAANTARQNYRDQATQAGKRSTAQSGNTTNRSDNVVFSNGIAKLTRPLTPGEAKRGFTGKITGDGRALVKFQGRVFAVPAARVGIKVPRTETSGAALATSWSPQKQASISGAIQKLATGGGNGRKPPGGGPCDPRKSLSCNFNAQATKPGEVIKVASPDVQARIKQAAFARSDSSGSVYRNATETKTLTTAAKNVSVVATSGYGSSIARIMPGSLPASEEAAVLNTLKHIDAGTKPTGELAKKWGSQFKNFSGDLPGAQGDSSPYREYRVTPSAGATGAGTNRIVVNSQTGEVFYTWTHYGDTGKPAFVKIR